MIGRILGTDRRRDDAARRRPVAGIDGRAVEGVDRSGCAHAAWRSRRRGRGRALVVRAAAEARASRRGDDRLAAQCHRSLRAGAARAREARAVAGGVADGAPPQAQPRSHRAAADAERSRRIPEGHHRRRLRPRRRPPARLAALRGALGAAMARPRALCRHQRPRKGQPPFDLEVPRLGHRRAQPRHAVRSVHDRADRRRHAARRHHQPAHRQRLPSQRHDQRGGRRRPGRVALRSARRSRQHDGDGVARLHGRLRAVPQPQVRSLLAEGLLPLPRVLRQPRLRDPRRRRRHALHRSTARPRHARAGARAQGHRGGDRAARNRAQDADAIAARGSAGVGAVAAAGRIDVDAAGDLQCDGDGRRRPGTAGRRVGARVGREPGDDDLHRRCRNAPRGHHRRAPRGPARSLAAEGRTRT